MSFPTTTPDTAPWANWLGCELPAPVGVDMNRTYADECARCAATCKRLVRVAYQLTGVEFITSPWQWGAYHLGMAANYLLEAHRRLTLMKWLAEGQPAAWPDYQLNGEATVNFSDRWTLRITAYTYPYVTIAYNAAGCDDPRRLTFSGAFTPADPFTGEDPSLPSYATALQVGDELCDAYGVRSLIRQLAWGASSVVATVRNPLNLSVPYSASCYREAGQPMAWDYPAPSRHLWVTRETTDWIDLATLENPELYSLCQKRIAWPILYSGGRQGTFRVMATLLDGGGLRDITETILGAVTDEDDCTYANFPSKGGARRLWITNNAGTWETFLDLSGLSATYGTVRIYYCPEVADQTAPPTGAIAPTQAMCRYCQLDFSGGLASFKSANPAIRAAGFIDSEATTPGETGPETTVWFCSKLDEGDVLEDVFRVGCYETSCPHFELNTPWAPSASQMRRLLLARDIRLRQVNLSAPQYSIGRVDSPGLCYLLGMTNPGNGGLYLPNYTWGGAAFGLEVGGDVTFEAINEDDGGTLKEGHDYTGKPSPAGGISVTRALRANSAHYDTDRAHYLRRLGTISTVDADAWAAGASEYAVQSVRTWLRVIEHIDLTIANTHQGRAECYAYVPNPKITRYGTVWGLICQFYALGGTEDDPGRPFPQKTISATAATVHASETIADESGRDYLKLQFTPEVVAFGAVPDPWIPRTVLTKFACVAGGTVDPPNTQRPTNPFCDASRAKYGDTFSKLREGDTVKVIPPGTPGYLLTCVHAEAFAGDVYDGTPSAPAGPFTAEAVLGGALEPDYLDVADVTIVSEAITRVDGYTVMSVTKDIAGVLKSIAGTVEVDEEIYLTPADADNLFTIYHGAGITLLDNMDFTFTDANQWVKVKALGGGYFEETDRGATELDTEYARRYTVNWVQLGCFPYPTPPPDYDVFAGPESESPTADIRLVDSAQFEKETPDYAIANPPPTIYKTRWDTARRLAHGWLIPNQKVIEYAAAQYLLSSDPVDLSWWFEYEIEDGPTRISPNTTFCAAIPDADYAVPCIPLIGKPDMTGIVVEWWYDAEQTWRTVSGMASEGLNEAAGCEFILPQSVRGYCAFHKGSNYYLVLSPVFWGHRVRVTYSLYTGETPPVDLTWPAGIVGVPSNYTGANRLKMDVAILEMVGFDAEVLKDHLIGGQCPPDTTVEVYAKSVMPPEMLYESDALVETGHTFTVKHTVKDNDSVILEETLSSAHYKFDRASGVLAIDDETVATWDTSKQHCIALAGQWFDRGQTHPAGLWVRLKNLLSQSYYLQAGPGIAGMTLRGYYEGLPNAYDQALRRYYFYHPDGGPVRSHNAWPENYIQPQWLIADPENDDDYEQCVGCQEHYGSGDPNWPFAVCVHSGAVHYTGGDEGILHAMGSGLSGTAVGCTVHETGDLWVEYGARYQVALFGRTGALLRLRSSDIEQALIDVQLVNSTFYHVDLDSDDPGRPQPDPTPGGMVRVGVHGFVFNPDGTVTVSSSGMGGAIEHSGAGNWITVDITDAIKAMLTDSPNSALRYGFVVRGGYGGDTLGGGSYNDLFYGWCEDLRIYYSGYLEGDSENGNGNPGSVSRRVLKCHRMTADNINFANVRIKLTADALAAAPYVFYRGERAGNCPPLVEAPS